MAEVLVSVVSETLLNKLIFITSQEIDLVWDVKNDLAKLHQTLTDIRAVLNDAEKKQAEDELVKHWLRKLKDVAYDAEDALDEFQYEALRRKLEIQGLMRKKVRSFFSHSNPLAFSLKMAHKIKDINQTLDRIAKDMDSFNFVVRSTALDNSFKSMEDRETSSLVDDSKVIGRELDKSKILDLLINSSNNQEIYSVVRIIGIGGIGKTALAQLVYNDTSITDHFDIKVWVCVSQNSNKKDIYSNLLESINGNRSNVSSLDVMVNSLRESLGRKRYLIVLDDVWSDGSINWEKMLTDLLFIGFEGSKIIMTTRSDDNIPSMMGSIYTHRLEGLPEDECWSLFEKIAFGHGGPKQTQNIIEIGRKIMKKCGGVPLAAKTLGGLMYSKTNEGEWLSIQNSEIWNLPEGEKKIIRVLKLSYDHLPQHLKRCFSYCSMFPKRHSIKKKKLIQLWMAEGFFMPSRENDVLGNIGKEYFSILLRNCFFEDDHGIRWEGKSYKMHDLVHDLATSVAGTEFSMSDGWTIEEREIKRLRYVRLVHNDQVSRIPQALHKAKKLRTFVYFTQMFEVKIAKSIWDHMFLELSYLRVLDLSRSLIKELPASIGKLKHLRYLDLSRTNLTTLPGSFIGLYNLQTLKLKYCYELKELPRDMKKLINLRNLITDKNGLTQMPRGVGKLVFLENLSVFIVGKGKGYGIEELRGLNLLGGKLEIYNLENVEDERDAMKADLKEKQNIRCLELYWICSNEKPNDIGDHYPILEGLQPHRNLKRLSIDNYVALKFPTWLMNPYYCLPNLVSLSLLYCYKCEHLPALGQLPFLQSLYMRGLKAVKRIGGEFYYNNREPSTRFLAPSIPFPSLKDFSIIEMPDLEEWSENLSLNSSSSSFPCLEKLFINGCSKIRTTPTLLPSLKTLQFEGVRVMPLMSLLTSNLESVTVIDIGSCSDLMFLPQVLLWSSNILELLCIHSCRNFEGFLQDHEEEMEHQVSNNSLRYIQIINCPVLKSLPYLRSLNSLRRLNIKHCESLKSLPNGLQCLTALEELRIGMFSEELNSFPFPAMRILEESNQCFISLRLLEISGWSRLKSLPDQLQYLTWLQVLIINRFPSLVTLPEWLGNLASLRHLRLYMCENLMYLPSQERMRCLTALQHLRLVHCPILEDRCSGDESHKIAHIPKFSISYDAWDDEDYF